jgi:hypothetical protein
MYVYDLNGNDVMFICVAVTMWKSIIMDKFVEVQYKTLWFKVLIFLYKLRKNYNFLYKLRKN